MDPREPTTELDDPQLLALGRIAYWAAHIERTTRDIAVTLMSEHSLVGDRVVLVTTAGMTYSELKALVQRLAKEADIAEDARSFLKRAFHVADSALQDRNTLLHANWFTHESTPVASLERRSSETFLVFDAETANRISFEVANAAEVLSSIHVALVAGLSIVEFGIDERPLYRD